MALVNLSAKVNHYSGMQKNVTNVLFSYLVTCGNENFHRNTQLFSAPPVRQRWKSHVGFQSSRVRWLDMWLRHVTDVWLSYLHDVQEISLLKKALKTVTDKVRRSELEVLAGKALY